MDFDSGSNYHDRFLCELYSKDFFTEARGIVFRHFYVHIPMGRQNNKLLMTFHLHLEKLNDS